MKKRILAAILTMTMIITMMPLNTFAASKYVKSLKLSMGSASLKEGSSVSLTATVTVKGKASKKISTAVSGTKYIKITKGTTSSAGKTKITIKALKPGKAKLKITTSGKNSKKKKISKTIPIEVVKAPVKPKEKEDIPDEKPTEPAPSAGGSSSSGGSSGGNTGGTPPAPSPNASASELTEIRALANQFTNIWYSKIQNNLKNGVLNHLYNGEYERLYNIIYYNDFNELSDAMKIYALSLSNYFGCHMSAVEYGMVYNNNKKYLTRRTDKMTSELKNETIEYAHAGYTIKSGDVAYFKEMLNELKNNNASGVCEDFVRYEFVYFTALGLTTYCNHSSTHAWTVVKTTNSDGKTMWIPFDYGSELVDKSLKYSYDTYIQNLPSIPAKNYTIADFK